MTDIPPMTDEELAGPYGRVPKVWCCSDCRYRWEERLLATIDAKDAEIAKEVYDRNAAEDVIEELRAEIDALTLTDALQAKLEQAEQALVAAESMAVLFGNVPLKSHWGIARDKAIEAYRAALEETR